MAVSDGHILNFTPVDCAVPISLNTDLYQMLKIVLVDPHRPLYLVSLCKTLKRKEKEYEHEMERLAREKIATQQRLAELKNELSQCMDVVEIDRVLRQTIQPEDDQASTSTASGTRHVQHKADILNDLHV